LVHIGFRGYASGEDDTAEGGIAFLAAAAESALVAHRPGLPSGPEAALPAILIITPRFIFFLPALFFLQRGILLISSVSGMPVSDPVICNRSNGFVVVSFHEGQKFVAVH
jgi:hypothetical protein